MRLKRLAMAFVVAVMLAGVAKIIIPTCYTFECLTCADWLDATLCALATGG